MGTTEPRTTEPPSPDPDSANFLARMSVLSTDVQPSPSSRSEPRLQDPSPILPELPLPHSSALSHPPTAKSSSATDASTPSIIHAIPTQAVRATRMDAHRLSPVPPLHTRASDSDLDVRQRHHSTASSRSHLAAALAALPWAEPPPRSPSIIGTSTPTLPVTTSSAQNPPRTPTYSFLQSDPVSANTPSPFRSASRASDNSLGSWRAGPLGAPPSIGAHSVPSSPFSDAIHFGGDQRRGSVNSGMADIYPAQQDDESVVHSLAAALSRLSWQSKSRRSGHSSRTGGTGGTRSKSSAKSIKSIKSIVSKRTSASTTILRPQQGQYEELGEWEEIDDEKEEHMDLYALAGRAVVLERLLRAGKRVSDASTLRPPRSSISSSRPFSSRSSRRGRLVTRSASIRSSLPPKSSLSLRRKLARRLTRNESREDLFTEISTQSSHGPRDDDIEVVVFPEDDILPPPLPEKPLLVHSRNNFRFKLTAQCCTTPTSPVPLLSGHDVEKGGYSGYVEQSPHLGHRSPNWRKRQSILSYISTGHWNPQERRKWIWAVGIGASIICLVIICLLASLLSRRKE